MFSNFDSYSRSISDGMFVSAPAPDDGLFTQTSSNVVFGNGYAFADAASSADDYKLMGESSTARDQFRPSSRDWPQQHWSDCDSSWSSSMVSSLSNPSIDEVKTACVIKNPPTTGWSNDDGNTAGGLHSFRQSRKFKKQYHNASRRSAMPYVQFRHGGTLGSIQNAPVLTFREFLSSQPGDIGDNPEEALLLYNEYKYERKRQMYDSFFQEHGEEEWFLSRYHPFYKNKRELRRREVVQKRLDVFMKLLVLGWLEVPLDATDQVAIQKVLAAAVILLDGGDDRDLEIVSAVQPRQIQTHQNKSSNLTPDPVFFSDDFFDELTGVNQFSIRRSNSQDSGLYKRPEDYANLKEQYISRCGSSTNMYVQSDREKCIDMERFFPIPAAILIRNIPAHITRSSLENVCRRVSQGFLRMRISEPYPQNNYLRQAVASYVGTINQHDVCMKLRKEKIGAYQMEVSELTNAATKRLAFVDALAADKSLVLHDIKLCRKLIEHCDKRCQLWTMLRTSEERNSQFPTVNPLLIKLNECLVPHLQDDSKPETISTGRIERDEELLRILDRLILYLRIVHSLDYYGCRYYEHEDDEPRRINVLHVRDFPSQDIRLTAEQKTAYEKKFDDNLNRIICQDDPQNTNQLERLGKRSYARETDKFVDSNIQLLEDVGILQCLLCGNSIENRTSARRHMYSFHRDKLEELELSVCCYNNFLCDVNRLFAAVG